MDTEQLKNFHAFIQSAGKLKDTLRSGRTSTGRQESTAEHSWRLALMAVTLQDDVPELDIARVLQLCIVHDLGEALGGDVPAPQCTDAAEKSERERRDLAALLAPLDQDRRAHLAGLWEEYELGYTPEAIFVKGLDKLETITQHNQGSNPPDFDHAFNLGYGAARTAAHPLLDAMRRIVDEETRERADAGAVAKAAGTIPPHAPLTLPAAHAGFLAALLPVLQADQRVMEVWAAGSYVSDQMDPFSDLDLRIVVADGEWESVLASRRAIAAACGTLLDAFTGEHVGQPNLLICLFDQALLHVDLLFLPHDAVAHRDSALCLWSRHGAAPVVRGACVQAPPVDLEWIEQRFWIWVHYGAGKIGRGEVMEALDFISYLRTAVLGPLALEQHKASPYGVRRVEAVLAPDVMAMLQKTVARYDRADCARALRECVTLYRTLRAARAGAGFGNAAAERAAVAYLDSVAPG